MKIIRILISIIIIIIVDVVGDAEADADGRLRRGHGFSIEHPAKQGSNEHRVDEKDGETDFTHPDEESVGKKGLGGGEVNEAE